MRLIQYAHGILTASDDPSKTFSKPLPSFNPLLSELPANPLASSVTPVAAHDPLQFGGAGNEALDHTIKAPAATESTDSSASDASGQVDGESGEAGNSETVSNDATDADSKTDAADADGKTDATDADGKTE